MKDLIASVKQELNYSSAGHTDSTGHFNILALSGGGANGAFGAGILYGWSAAGTRPTFKIVTGISTGALIAPYAFLGSDYDPMLKQVYTSVATQVFLYGDILDIDDVVDAAGLSSIGPGRIYIIQNLQSIPLYKSVKPNLVDIAKKTVSGLLTNQSIGDLYRIYTTAQREGIKFKLVYIPSEFELQPSELFDPVVMEQLFDLGYQMAQSGDPWKNSPPGLKD